MNFTLLNSKGKFWGNTVPRLTIEIDRYNQKLMEIEGSQEDEEEDRKWKELLDRVTAGRAPPPTTTKPTRKGARRGGKTTPTWALSTGTPMKRKRSQTVEPPPPLDTTLQTEQGCTEPEHGKIISPKRNVQGANNGQTEQTTSQTPAKIETAMKLRYTQLISDTDLEKVTSMQAEKTPVKVMKTLSTHEDTRGEGEERKTVTILNITTLAKEGNFEGGGGTPKRRNEILIEGMEYLSPAKKRKTNFDKLQKFWTKKEQKSKPSDFEITKNYYRGEILPLVMPQTKDSNSRSENESHDLVLD